MSFNPYAMDTTATLVAAAAVAVWPGAAALLDLPLLGIPLLALTSALLGAGFSYLGRSTQAVDTASARMIGIATDAFLGGWIAVGLFYVPQMEGYGFKAIPIEAVAGLSAYLMQVTRKRAGDYFERLFQTGLNVWAGLFTRGKRSGEDAP